MRRFWDFLCGAAVLAELYAMATGREMFSDYTRARLRTAHRVAGQPYPYRAALRNPRVAAFWLALAWFAGHTVFDCWSLLKMWRRYAS